MINRISKLTGTAMLISIIIVLQILSNYITLGSVSITLSLIPIVVGACIYGRRTGALLGFVMGFFTIIAPATLSIFFSYNPLGTIVTCLVKSTVAGYISGVVFEIFKKRAPRLGSIFASIIIPIVNTGLFVVGVLIFFKPLISEFASAEGEDFYKYLFLSFIGINFIIEFATNAILSIVVYQVYLFVYRRELKKSENN